MVLNVLSPVLMIRLMFFGLLLSLLFSKTVPAMMRPVCMGQLISICPITADGNFVHLIQGLSARFLD